MANFSFKAAAEKELSLSPLMAGREQLKTEALDGQTVTVIAFDFAEVGGKVFPVLLFKEYPNHYYNGGLILSKLCSVWASAFEDLDAANEALQSEGGVRLACKSQRTKSGNSITTFNVC